MTKNDFKILSGFTLAEVLITLAIIGIVAALTIPSLINNTNDLQYKVAWKKSYSDISQATSRLVFDNGGSIQGIYTWHSELVQAYGNYFAKSKECLVNAGSENCAPVEYKYLYGDVYPTAWLINRAALVLNNGTILYFDLKSKDCTNNDSTYITNRCAIITVDVNGTKPPNIIGKDVFSIHLFHNRIKPTGCNGDPDCNDWWTPALSCRKGAADTDNTGGGCSAKYLAE